MNKNIGQNYFLQDSMGWMEAKKICKRKKEEPKNIGTGHEMDENLCGIESMQSSKESDRLLADLYNDNISKEEIESVKPQDQSRTNLDEDSKSPDYIPHDASGELTLQTAPSKLTFAQLDNDFRRDPMASILEAKDEKELKEIALVPARIPYGIYGGGIEVVGGQADGFGYGAAPDDISLQDFEIPSKKIDSGADRSKTLIIEAEKGQKIMIPAIKGKEAETLLTSADDASSDAPSVSVSTVSDR